MFSFQRRVWNHSWSRYPRNMTTLRQLCRIYINLLHKYSDVLHDNKPKNVSRHMCDHHQTKISNIICYLLIKAKVSLDFFSNNLSIFISGKPMSQMRFIYLLSIAINQIWTRQICGLLLVVVNVSCKHLINISTIQEIARRCISK